MTTMYENLCDNSVGRIELTVHRRAILKIVKSICNGKKKQMHAHEMSSLLHPHSCHINFRAFIHNHFESLIITFFQHTLRFISSIKFDEANIMGATL
jgi:hypothetical protein